MLSFVVWCFACTEIPYSSSQTLKIRGTCKTPAAFIVSKKTPSVVLAFPIVPHAISFPLIEKLDLLVIPGTSRYILEACASPSNRGICAAVGEMSALEFFCLVKFFQVPSSFKLCVTK